MKKFALLLTAVLMTAIGADVFAQGSQQTVTINSTRNYWVNSTDGSTQDVTGHDGSIYQWAVYTWDGLPATDYTLDSWTATAATAATDYSFIGGSTSFNAQITWLKTGAYVVEVVETNGEGCTTVRRFGVTVIDLDLLVVTKNHLDVELSAPGEYCNTNEGDIWGDSHDDNLNVESLATMTMTYEISLYTVKGSTTSTDLIGTALPAAAWKFTAADASTIPTSGNVTWTVTGSTSTYTTGESNEIFVPAETSTVTITAQIQNIAADDAEQYLLDFSVSPATVLVDNGGTTGVYEEGQEPATYDGLQDTESHLNEAQPITVKPIPNTTKIKFD